MATVFVTSLGSVAADITIKTLRRYGHRVVGCDINPREWVVDSMRVDAFYRAPLSSVDLDAYLDFIDEVCEKESVDYLFPLTDVEVDVFNAHRDRPRREATKVCISSQEALDVARNKKTLAEFVEQNLPQIATIPTKPLKGCSCPPWDFPLMVKPLDGRSSIGVHRVYCQGDWDALGAIEDPGRYIVQPLISGHNVVTDVVCQPDTDQCVAIAREELIDTINYCGLTVRMFHDERLERNACDLAKRLGVKGAVNFEWIVDADGEYHLIECNPRFSAGTEFSHMSGYDVVGNHMRCFKGERIDDYAFGRQMIIARKYEEYVTKIFDE